VPEDVFLALGRPSALITRRCHVSTEIELEALLREERVSNWSGSEVGPDIASYL
jgi:hypothetical protein